MNLSKQAAGWCCVAVSILALASCTAEPVNPDDNDAAATINGNDGTAETSSEQPDIGIDNNSAVVCDDAATHDAELGLRPDVQPSGNRVVPGRLEIEFDQPTVVELPERPQWIVSAPNSNADDSGAPKWFVILETGAVVSVDHHGRVDRLELPIVEWTPQATTANSETPLVDVGAARAAFTDALVDTRVVHSGRWTAALTQPTDRYGHGVLGDKLEAGAIELIDRCSNERIVIDVERPDVIEGLAPLLIDPNLSPTDDVLVLVTVSNAETGARLVVFDLTGAIVAESAPIGTGNRWRNQLAAGPIGPGGSFAVVDVRTPHIGGTVQWFSVDLTNKRLDLVAASEASFTTHVIGSRNLDLGVAVDVDGDGRPEVVVPSAQRDQLFALRPTEAGSDGTLGVLGADVVQTMDLDGRMVTNLGVGGTDSSVSLAVGTDDNRLLIFD